MQVAFIAVTTSLWKPDISDSIAKGFCKLLGQFVRMRSMREGLSGILKHVGLLFILVRIQQGHKFLMDESSTPAFKSPKKISWSYLV